MKLLTRLRLRCFSYSLLSIFIFSISLAQVQYAPLLCEGEVPADFKIDCKGTILEEYRKIRESKDPKKIQNQKREFAVYTTIGFDELILNGKILYGDVLTKYATRTLDNLLEHDPALRKKLSIYVLKSSSINALTTPQGVILVTVGLLAQIQSEAELAYILSHEISHFTLQHSYHRFKRSFQVGEKYDFGGRTIRVTANDFEKYSKENELEADKEGLKLYLKSRFSASGALSALKMLADIQNTNNKKNWTIDDFQDEYFKFPPEIRTNLKAIQSDASPTEKDVEESSTHPNIEKRIDEMITLLNQSDGKGELLNIQSEELLKQVKQQAAIENIFIGLNQTQYIKTYILAKQYAEKYQEKSWTSKVRAYCLLAFQKPEGKVLNGFTFSFDEKKLKLTGTLSNFISNLDEMPMAVIRVRLAWEALQNNPNDDFAKHMMDFALISLSNDGFNKDFFISVSDSIHMENYSNDKFFCKLGFSTYLQNNEFKSLFNDNSLNDSTANKVFSILDIMKFDTYTKRFGNAGGIGELILFNPIYSQYIFNVPSYKYQLPELEREMQFTEMLHNMSEKAGIKSSLIDLNNKEELSTDKINMLSITNDILGESFTKKKGLATFQSQYNKELINQHHTSHILLTSIRNSETFKNTFRHQHTTELVFIVADISTGELKYIHLDDFALKIQKTDFMKSQFYSFFYILKTEKK